MSSITDKCGEDVAADMEERFPKSTNGNPFCKKGGCDKPLIECFRQNNACPNFHDECTEEQNTLKEMERKRVQRELDKVNKKIERLNQVKKFLDSQVGGTTIGCGLGTLGCFVVIAAVMFSAGLGILMCKYAWIFLKYCWNLAV